MGNRLARFCIQPHYRSLPLSFLGLSLLTVGASARERMPGGSYLPHQPKTILELNRELDNPAVAERYAKLFRMPPAMVRLALADLKIQPLQEDRTMEVWYVNPSRTGEKFGYRLHKLKKGTLVFAMTDGTPVLTQGGGNPVRMMPLPVAAQVDLVNLPEYKANPELVLSGETNGLDTGSDVVVNTMDGPPDDFVEVSIPDVELPLPDEPPALLKAHSKRQLSLWLLPALGLLPPFGSFGGGGGGTVSNTLPPPPGGGDDVPPDFPVNPAATPEPGAIPLLGAGFVFGAVCLCRRRCRPQG